ncbi:MAG: nucleotidyltransferase domain-containing protein [Bacteroidetes bacterium]|nr:MAG: nucleotidyltransferase domain-containing protein [Bacteroidota bacterium]
MNLDERKIQKINNYFRARPVLKAYLFGSFVRGDADNKSDIDILADLDYTQKLAGIPQGFRLNNKWLSIMIQYSFNRHLAITFRF